MDITEYSTVDDCNSIPIEAIRLIDLLIKLWGMLNASQVSTAILEAMLTWVL